MMTSRIKRSILAVAIALTTLSATAAGKVEVTGDITHGTVTSKADGAVVTITVTPASGYYIRKSDISATKTYMPVAEARRQSIPIADQLTLVGSDPDNLSLPRSYTITLPSEEYDILLDVKYWTQSTITDPIVSLSETVFVYNGQEQRPTVIVSGLTEGRDYRVDYAQSSPIEAGTYTLTVTGLSTWQGTVSRSYQIIRGGKAEVNNSLRGGTIATTVDGTTVTLTVTPADGYYVRKEDVAVYKTFMPVTSDARSSIPITDQLTLKGDDPDDLSQPRTYTTELPGWEYSTFVNAVFTERRTVTADMVSLSPGSFVYNGTDQQPQVSVSGLTEGVDYLLAFDGTSWSDVNTYALTVTGRSTWKGTVNKTFAITKAPSVITQAPEAQQLTYTAAQQTLVSVGDCIGGTLLYSLDGNDYQTTLPAAMTAGTYIVYYKVQGDHNHSDSQPATVTVTIGRKDIVIDGIKAADKVYDGTTAVTLNYDDVAFSGLLAGEMLTVTAQGAFADSNVGDDKTVIISNLVLGGTDVANYQLATTGQQTEAKAAISSKTLIVKAHDQTMLHGLAMPELTCEYDGFVDGETEDVLTVKPVITTTAETGSLPGSYDIIVSGGEASNYDFSYVNALLTVKLQDLTLDETTDNSSYLADNNGLLCNMTLKRTLLTGGYNTLALPFDVSIDQMKEVFGEDVMVKRLVSSTLSDGMVTITFANAENVEAGHPYMVKVGAAVENPVFKSVTLSSTVKTVETLLVDFIPALGATVITGENTKRLFFVSAGNRLYNPTSLPSAIRGFRGYFMIKDLEMSMIRSLHMSFGDELPTAVNDVTEKTMEMTRPLYNINGIRVDVPNHGIYVVEGKKVLIKR